MIALDTNVLVYAEGFGDTWKVRCAEGTSIALPPDRVVIPVQVLAELYRVLVRKGRLASDDARVRVLRWQAAFSTAPYDASILRQAIDMAVAHGHQIFDALIISVAAAAGCDVLLSEDMQDGATFAGVMIVNPFATHPDPRIAPYLPS